MKLKKYQQRTIEELRDYLKLARKTDSNLAFYQLKEQPYKKEYFGSVPYVCIKIPTGGGKTFVASHAVTSIMNNYLTEKLDKGIVMWFVPSEAIKTQTLSILKDRKNPLRATLDEYFENGVKVLSNEEALRIRKSDVDHNVCIIISSLEAFRKDKRIQSKYKVYKENGELLSFFENVESDVLEKDESGVINSLANVIKLNNPLVIIDEGHKVKTSLSFEVMKDLNPSFIMEMTATPRKESNILVEVNSSELKEEEMVKIPLVLDSLSQWQNAVQRGVAKQKELEKIAKKGREKIRPIVLLQAEQEKESTSKIYVAQLKKFLIDEYKIPEEQIAIKTANNNELAGIDLFSNDCPIRYIITVNALAEGWDCSYAYILVSVANIGSRISVEQIIGRIIRQPFAKLRKIKELNQSYIFASAKNFNEAANQIIKGLEENGFSRSDLINVKEKAPKYELEVERAFKENVEMPLFIFGKDKLQFSDLIGTSFKLAKQDSKLDFKIHYDQDGRVIIDLEGEEWSKTRQSKLNVVYDDKNFSETELVKWLDKKMRFIMLEKEDKMSFIGKVIEQQLKKYSLAELSVNRFVLKTKLEEHIYDILYDYAKKQFELLVKKGKIKLKPMDKFPEKIILSDKSLEKFNNNYYEELDKRVNKEELDFLRSLDVLDNVKFWVRNREKKDPFYIQGWQNRRFYPDFIFKSKKGNLIAVEWKGEHLVSNEDTRYKLEVAELWEKISKGKIKFFLAHNGNKEQVLNELKDL